MWYTMFIRATILFGILMVVWLLMSGHYTPLVTGLGVVSVGFATWMAVRINGHDREGLPFHLMAGLPGYILWLFREIAVSNISTIRLILVGQADPVLFRVPYTQKTAAGVATYANSITLTPGTVTVEITEGEFLVHAVSRELADDVKSGGMDEKVTRIEGVSG